MPSGSSAASVTRAPMALARPESATLFSSVRRLMAVIMFGSLFGCSVSKVDGGERGFRLRKKPAFVEAANSPFAQTMRPLIMVMSAVGAPMPTLAIRLKGSWRVPT